MPLRRATAPGTDGADGPRGARWTITLRLTALYGALFLVTGAVLLTVTYLLVAHSLRWVTVEEPSIPEVNGPFGDAGPPQPEIAADELASHVANQRDEDLRRLLVASVLALAGMTLVSVGLGWLMARRALRPLRVMTQTTKEISERNLHRRIALRGPRDELKELADTVDGLLGRLDDAFEAQRRFVANASHELRTPLTLERSLLEVALADPGSSAEDLRETCRRVLAGNHDQERLIETLLTLARSQRGLDSRAPLDLAEAARRPVAAAREAAESRRVGLDVELGGAPTEGDEPLVTRLISNLVDNAVRYNVPDGRVWVRTGTDENGPFLAVRNTGPVVRPDQIELLFQPFQRLDTRVWGPREGLGLGLSIVAAIVTAHGATLRAVPAPGGGLDLRVGFPPVAGSAVPSRRAALPGRAPATP